MAEGLCSVPKIILIMLQVLDEIDSCSTKEEPSAQGEHEQIYYMA